MPELPPHIDRYNAREVSATLTACLPSTGSVEIDLSPVERIDSSGVAVLAGLAREASRRSVHLGITGLRPEVRETLALFPFPTEDDAPTGRATGLLERLGQQTVEIREITFHYVVLCADVAWFTFTGLFRRRGIRWGETFVQMAQIGSSALLVVGLIAFLVGGTMALQSAQQLRNFGANIFVVDLVSLAVTRELGPLITAIVIAGRSGSAVAAEVGTMRITEELDALRTMGINPIRFLIAPKVIAITITQPLLTMFANLLAIGGGFVVAVTYLEVGPAPFFNRLREVMLVSDILTGLLKSVAFANLIVTIGTLYGLRTGGGADAVGRSTTTSVVVSIFAVIVADAVFSLVFYF